MENLQIQQRRQRPEPAAGSSTAELPTPSSSSSSPHLKSVPSDSNLNKEGNNNEGLHENSSMASISECN
jgi:hypothetical protein